MRPWLKRFPCRSSFIMFLPEPGLIFYRLPTPSSAISLILSRSRKPAGTFPKSPKFCLCAAISWMFIPVTTTRLPRRWRWGAKGVISVLANIVPRETHQLCQSYFDGRPEESDNLQLRYLELIENLFSDVNPIPVKRAMNAMGMEVGECRLPLCAMEEVAEERLLSCLKRYGLIEDAKAGSVTVRRPEAALLWRHNH